jgi:hypothetical protein
MFKTLAILPENGFLAGKKCTFLSIYSPKSVKACHLLNKIRLLVYLLILRRALLGFAGDPG